MFTRPGNIFHYDPNMDSSELGDSALRQRVVGAPLQPVAGSYLATVTIKPCPKSMGGTPCHPKFDTTETYGFGDPLF